MKIRAIVLFLLCIITTACRAAAGKGETVALPAVIDRSSQTDAWPEFAFADDAKLLEIWMPDIRDADAAILLYDGEVWMIDCGDERAARRLVILLGQLGIQKIDRLFNSHPHHDHLNGLEMTADAAAVAELMICFPEDSTEHMKRALTFAKDRGIRVTHYGDGDVYAMGDGSVTLEIWQKEREDFTMNDMSAQTMIRYGKRSMLFMADMENPGQRLLLEEAGPEALKADILKYPHHGKLTMVDAFLNAVSPELAVITNYRQFGESYRYLLGRKIPVVYTNRDKLFLHLATDGAHWICEYVPIKK